MRAPRRPTAAHGRSDAVRLAPWLAAAGGAVAILLVLRGLGAPSDSVVGDHDGVRPIEVAREADDHAASSTAGPRLSSVLDLANAADVRRLRDVALHAADAACAARALQALGRRGRVADDPALVRLVHDVRPVLRDQAILALGASRDPERVDDLAPLLSSTDRQARWLAIHALGDIGGARAEALLEATLAVPEPGLTRHVGVATPPDAGEAYEDR